MTDSPFFFSDGMSGLGDFELLPKDVMVYLMERTSHLTSLQCCSKVLNKFIREVVCPHIERQMKNLETQTWQVINTPIECCQCRNKNKLGIKRANALNPDEHQPSGTMNWSRIDNVYFTIIEGKLESINPVPSIPSAYPFCIAEEPLCHACALFRFS